jgi:hypothetical protein
MAYRHEKTYYAPVDSLRIFAERTHPRDQDYTVECWTGIPVAGPRSAHLISLFVHGTMRAPTSSSIFVVILMMPRKSPCFVVSMSLWHIVALRSDIVSVQDVF